MRLRGEFDLCCGYGDVGRVRGQENLPKVTSTLNILTLPEVLVLEARD